MTTKYYSHSTVLPSIDFIFCDVPFYCSMRGPVVQQKLVVGTTTTTTEQPDGYYWIGLMPKVLILGRINWGQTEAEKADQIPFHQVSAIAS